jgi:hypothetical protein
LQWLDVAAEKAACMGNANARPAPRLRRSLIRLLHQEAGTALDPADDVIAVGLMVPEGFWLA